MKTIVAALIEKDGKYLIAKRKSDQALGGLWEYPGGKVEGDETEAEALERDDSGRIRQVVKFPLEVII